MNRKIFRNASIERVSSPEQLNDYIKVSRPGVWLILAAVIVLLVGVCVWGIYGKLTTTQEAMTVVQDGIATCYVTPETAQSLKTGMEVRLEGHTGHITAVASTPMALSADFDPYALYLSGQAVGDWVIPVTTDLAAPDGSYLSEIVLESISPIFFVLN